MTIIQYDFSHTICSVPCSLEVLIMMNKECVGDVLVNHGAGFLHSGCHGRWATAEHAKHIHLQNMVIIQQSEPHILEHISVNIAYIWTMFTSLYRGDMWLNISKYIWFLSRLNTLVLPFKMTQNINFTQAVTQCRFHTFHMLSLYQG